ncbi:MAG: hypothetical protein K2X39_02500 [Silvanigrellaceae bacterium]|nr:hypothetical protein [Silvanigrellaceae bacterium]
MTEKKLQKKINKLHEKNPARCSMCKLDFRDDCASYTCTGYDSIGRLQVTSQCCHQKIKRLVNIGLCGFIDPNEFNEEIKKHPLYEQFYK